MSNKTPIRVDASFTPSGTQDVNIVSSITLAISAASLPLPTGAATETTLAAVLADLDKFTFTSTRLLVDGSGVIQPVSGTVAVSNFPASQTVLQGTTPWIVDGSGTVQPVSGSFLTDTQLRATPVPVSGTITTSPNVNVHDGTGTSISSTGSSLNVDVTNTVPVTGTFFQATQPVSGVGDFTVVQPTGTNLHTTVDNFPATQPVSGTVAVTQSTSPWVISGAVTAAQSGTWNINNISGTVSLPTGAATESTLSSLNGKVTVVNTGAVTVSTALPAGTNVIGHVITDSGSTVAISNFPATQPVSGTVTANQGTPNTASNKWPIEIVDSAGVNIAAVSAANALKVDGSGVTQPISGTVSISGTVPVSGTITANQGTSPWVVSGTVTANAGTNLNTSLLLLDSTFTGRINTLGQKTSANSTPVVVASDQSAIPVSGTVTANIGTTNGLALDATLTGGTQKTKIVDSGGTNVASVSAAGAVKVDGSAVTQPISAASLPLPTGASTAALQTQPGVDIGDVTVNNTSGAGAVNIQDGGNSITVDGTVAVTQSTSPWVSNITQFGSSNVVTGTGVSGAGIPRVTVSNDSNILATQSGTWTVQPGNTPNTSPWLVEQRAPGTLTTYSASTLGLVVALTPTDIFTIYGSGTKTVKITRIEISATENTAAVRDIVLIKRSATNTGGTSASATRIPHDSNNAAATATVLSYTANPAALGASVGNIRTAKLDIPATNLTGSTDRIVWLFGDRPGQAIVLRGTSEGIAVNLNSVTSASSSFNINIEWSEE